MANTEAWDRIAARGDAAAPVPDAVQYGPDVPSERELRLCGDLAGKRVLDLGCGDGDNAILFARAGAHAIGLDSSAAQLTLARQRADLAEVRVEWHHSDAAALAFLRAESIDLAFTAGMLNEVEDLDRLLRQVHRVLRPGAHLVAAYEHPLSLVVGRDTAAAPGALPLGRLEVLRSYFDPGPLPVRRRGESLTVWPRTLGEMFAALHRAGFRVEALVEPEPLATPDPGPAMPTTVVWRARKEGL